VGPRVRLGTEEKSPLQALDKRLGGSQNPSRRWGRDKRPDGPSTRSGYRGEEANVGPRRKSNLVNVRKCIDGEKQNLSRDSDRFPRFQPRLVKQNWFLFVPVCMYVCLASA
jgi:hypothetical protein